MCVNTHFGCCLLVGTPALSGFHPAPPDQLLTFAVDSASLTRELWVNYTGLFLTHDQQQDVFTIQKYLNILEKLVSGWLIITL